MMKKYVFVLLLGSLTVAGCSNNGNTSAENKTADKAIVKTTDEPVVKTVKSTSKSDEKPIHITKADFLNKVMDYEANPKEWIYKGDRPCLIDFYADWCGPCKIASPILEDLANIYGDKIYIYKVNTEQERELSSVFGISSIPAFLFCPQEGKPTMSSGIGRTPEDTKQMFIKMIDELLLNKGTKETL